MQHLITPYTGETNIWARWDNGFSNQELDHLQTLARNASTGATVGRDGLNDDSIDHVRRSLISWMYKTEETRWVYDKFSHIVSDINSNFFRFDLTGFGEPMQLTNYLSENTGTYNWHIDMGSVISRKLSVVLQLSDPLDYEGGNLELLTEANPISIPRQRGLVTIFPSWTLHRVSPVTKGSRQSLVLWVSGSPFR